MKKYLLTMLAVLAGSNMWAQKFSTENGDNTLVITTDGDMTAQSYADKVSAQMKDGDYRYSKVIVNGNGTISEAFLRAILYKNESTADTLLLNLDLTGITLKGWNSSSFKASEKDNWVYRSTSRSSSLNIIPCRINARCFISTVFLNKLYIFVI